MRRKLRKYPAEQFPRIAGWLVPGHNCTDLQYLIVRRAFLDVGVMESPPGSNRGKRIDRYCNRAGSPPGSWWCAIWAGAVYADCGAVLPPEFAATDSWLPYLRPEPVPGAAVLYGLRKRGPVMPAMDSHHIGIVVRIEPEFPWPYSMLTIEGNRAFAGTTNNGVAVDLGPPNRRDILGYYHPETE